MGLLSAMNRLPSHSLPGIGVCSDQRQLAEVVEHLHPSVWEPSDYGGVAGDDDYGTVLSSSRYEFEKRRDLGWSIRRVDPLDMPTALLRRTRERDQLRETRHHDLGPIDRPIARDGRSHRADLDPPALQPAVHPVLVRDDRHGCT